MNKIVLNDNNASSPFDQIKQVDTDGFEYWLARELMPILGYQQWRQFEDAVNRAIAACENMGHDQEKHFLQIYRPSPYRARYGVSAPVRGFG
ncbi:MULTISPECIES: hypothetical protein [unclassified Nostoc]|uniref:hypothetical protein n=1 Tax=unclassified Nostoc TaxID=2593658 RepID=UPI002AD1D54A|nr:hypothetical protein [Nostoc sp. DedQUE03]MDZ7973700.1 hypothetical protein [Nostoc sp. DedQUE03]MDZ8048184.1 hypothetical protein [Nostoc sp. DedQUE02]